MARKLFLALARGEPARLPTVDVVRKRLGGRAATEPGAGELVSLVGARGASRVGVVLFVRGEDLDIWIEGGIVKRTRRASTRPVMLGAPAAPETGAAAVSDDVLAVATDARLFAHLEEGQLVRYRHPAGVGEGALIEKCRFGALIEKPDGTVLGIGFRRLWAASDHTDN